MAAICTHGMVFSGINLNEPLPIWSYQGFFQNMLLTTERLWSYAHGWESMSHIGDFGKFYAVAVQLICPILAFALFWSLSRVKIGINAWKPMSIALVLAFPTAYIFLAPTGTQPWLEALRTVAVFLLMVWSAGVSRGHLRRVAPAIARPS